MVSSRPASFEAPAQRRLKREVILQHLQPATQAVSSDGVPGLGETDKSRAACPWVHVLGPVCRDAFLPAWACAFPPRDLRRAVYVRRQTQPSWHHCSLAFDIGIRERASTL